MARPNPLATGADRRTNRAVGVLTRQNPSSRFGTCRYPYFFSGIRIR